MYRRVIRELSKGFKQRTALAQALIHDPQIVVLDEPTSGLDPHQILEIRDLIRRLGETKTVILSTHILQEVQATADRIVIINRGRIVGDGSIDRLRSQAKRHERTRVAVLAPREEAERLLSGISAVQRVEFLDEDDGCVRFNLMSKSGESVWRDVNELARRKEWVLRELSEAPPTLEETFLALTERQNAGAAAAATEGGE
jgi:ABC-2 type transport system ATP-binding protein